ncbi:hypothetical protein C8T65DRAFT_143821 [Cerioporus squamosus]|nr:hypothetical protein C8T65DRAFT_143821 [Cerioporus squamosus]
MSPKTPAPQSGPWTRRMPSHLGNGTPPRPLSARPYLHPSISRLRAAARASTPLYARRLPSTVYSQCRTASRHQRPPCWRDDDRASREPGTGGRRMHACAYRTYSTVQPSSGYLVAACGSARRDRDLGPELAADQKCPGRGTLADPSSSFVRLPESKDKRADDLHPSNVGAARALGGGSGAGLRVGECTATGGQDRRSAAIGWSAGTRQVGCWSACPEWGTSSCLYIHAVEQYMPASRVGSRGLGLAGVDATFCVPHLIVSHKSIYRVRIFRAPSTQKRHRCLGGAPTGSALLPLSCA